MYENQPVLLSPRSNREDFLLPVSIFDDDTGQPINLSYTVTASGFAFTGNNWTILVGNASVFYGGTLTIPVPPINNELSAVNIAFTAGQNILPGAPLKVVDATGNNYMLGTVTSYNNSTGALVCQFGNTFQFEIRRGAPRNDGSGYVPWYDFGTPGDIGPIIKAALGTGVTIIDIGVLQVLILEINLRGRLHLGTYHAYLTMFDGTNTRQVFTANLPILYGGVTQ